MMHRTNAVNHRLLQSETQVLGARSRLLCAHASAKNAAYSRTSNSLPDVQLSLLEDGVQSAELITVQLPENRPLAPTPSVVPVVHSKAYYIQNNHFKIEDVSLPAAQSQHKPAQTGSLLEIAIRSIDEQLDEIERNPPPVQKAIYAMSQGPVGQATAQGVQAAAKLTMQATLEAARLAAPVGGWVLKQGAKTALNWMTYAITQEQRQSSTVKIQKRGKQQKRR